MGKGWRLLTLPALLVLEQLHGAKGGATSEQLMAELALVVGLVLVVDLVVPGVVGHRCQQISHPWSADGNMPTAAGNRPT